MSDGVHCCWPNQGWRSSTMTCIGVPACPRGLQAAGEDCVSNDLDGDGILNAKDGCPRQAEDRDGNQDDDGCPEDDDDDGVSDALDRCPDQSEDLNRFEDDDGCPDDARRLEVEATQQALVDATERRVEAWLATQPKAAVGRGNSMITFHAKEPGVVETVTHVVSGTTCQTPCTMRVPGGSSQEFTVSGPSDVTTSSYTPLVGAHHVLETSHRRSGRYALGMTMFVTGLVASGLGLLVTVAGAVSEEGGGEVVGPGVAMLLGGTALWLPGEILWVTAKAHFDESDKPRLQVGAAPTPGGAAGALRWTF